MGDKTIIQSNFPFESKYIEVKGSKMHYIDEGKGTPFIFLHGNPTSNYLWRNIIPHIIPHGRAIAPDLIGMGKSDKPEIDYRFLTHSSYVEEFIEKLELKDVILVLHDWGSGIGFHYACRNEENVKGIAFMESILKTMTWKGFPFIYKLIFKRFRNEKKGKKMIMGKNFFVERMLKMATRRKLGEAEMSNYRKPYSDYKSRYPLFMWPNEIPIDGHPADNHEAITKYSQWLKETELPKLMLWFKPGGLIPKKAVPQIEASFKNLESIYIGKGRHYVQEDHPDAIGNAIAAWYNGL